MKLDHIAIACKTLEEGRAVVEEALSVTLQPGGQHDHFGTHNLLLGLANGLYLEVIAIDPEAAPLPYPRWFDLDRFEGAPRLTNWICQVESMTEALSALPEAGKPVALTRGALRWQMAVPGDGALPYDAMFPALIEWGAGVSHPSGLLSPSGCRLKRLVVSHPDAEALAARLRPDLRDPCVVFDTGPAALRAEFETPNGLRVLT
ncbi:VOC family protein [Roseovarius pelagicus]|uniref:VOC family protein n=1 Tax=Roseovarius pelagicus TaxID=2980108 RepID=A0ABY6DDF6_9RHOB|nr:VOC family protein [Roseovarius pelagicus]UXX84079.1 VOC family protein [Roseovarius pelagicus]